MRCADLLLKLTIYSPSIDSKPNSPPNKLLIPTFSLSKL